MLNNINNQKGFAALLVTILILAAVFSIGTSIFILSYGEQKIIKNIARSSQAYYLAESGLEDAIYRVKKSMNLPPSYSISSNGVTALVSVDEPNVNTRIITANAGKADVFRKLKTQLSIDAINPQFFYGAQAGVLGIEMSNNSEIKGAGGLAGNVYSNGSISGGNNSKITGNVFVATGMAENQFHAVYNSDQIFGKTNPVIDIAQSFSPSISDKLVEVGFYIKKVGTPDDRTVRIVADNGGSPSKTVLASGTLRKTLVGTSFGWVEVVFSSPPNLTQDTTYWLMVDASQNSSNYWVWGKDNNQGYGNGQAKYSQDWNAASPVWTAIAGDLNFKTYLGGQATFLDEVEVIGDARVNTITESKICGDAYYRTIDAESLNFLNNPASPCQSPFTPGAAFSGSSDPPLQNMPISDSNINQWKQEATDGGIYSGDLTVNSDMSFGPKKINGNLLMESNNKTLTITGTIYVTGYIKIDNNSTIQCDASYGFNSCVVIADQWIKVSANSSFQGSGESGSYIMILSTSDCDGTSQPGCGDHYSAIKLTSGVTGAIFYANDGLIYLYNGVQVSEVSAKKIILEENASITYEQGLVNASFPSGPGGSWEVDSWGEIE